MLLAGGGGGAFVELQRASLRRGIRPGMSTRGRCLQAGLNCAAFCSGRMMGLPWTVCA